MNDEPHALAAVTKKFAEAALDLGKHKDTVRDLRISLGQAIQVIAAMKVEGVVLRSYSADVVADVLRQATATNLSTYGFDSRRIRDQVNGQVAP